MNVRNSITGIHPEKSTNMQQYYDWDCIDWTTVIQHVNKLQTRIAKAVKAGKKYLVKRLSYLLTHSYYAKLLAVRRVTGNKGRKTPGVDGVLWITSEEKLQAANSLTDKGYKAKPLRRVLIDKKGKTTKRPLDIPTMYDRAMQELYALSLRPIAETTGDTHSFGFRMGRSAQDALVYTDAMLAGPHKAEWIIDADIKGCFDHISHDWLMHNIPMDKSILAQFLKSGYIFEEQLFPTDEGTPQGRLISPILANMTLDGLQQMLNEKFPKQKVHLLRYADDMVITAKSYENALEVKSLIVGFLKQRGLELSEEKTRIVHINEGYDFLGWHIQKHNGKLKITPSAKSIKAINEKLHEAILDKGLALNQKELIQKLNPILRGWSNYHKVASSKKIFCKVAHNLFEKLQRWGKRRHPNKNNYWIKNRYWHTKGKRNWVFADEEHELFNIASVRIANRMPLKLDKNPFLDRQYFARRKEVLATR